MTYQANCGQDEFMVQSEDEGEVVQMVKEHARDKHGSEMNDDDVRDMIEQT